MKARILISILFLLALAACSPVFENLPAPAAPVDQPIASPSIEDLPAALPEVATETPAPAPVEAVEPLPTDGPPLGLTVLEGESYDMHVAGTIEHKDLDTFKWMLGEQFGFLKWNSELLYVDAPQAMERLRSELFTADAQPVVRFGTDIPHLLGGIDPLDAWGPVVNPVRAMHVMGLGLNAADEAVFVIANDANGHRYVLGVILPPGGYFQVEQDDRVSSTDVRYVMALANVRLRTGPGFEYAQEGLVYEGQIAAVTGISKDGKWWRVGCAEDISGNCWVSADTELTQPTEPPR